MGNDTFLSGISQAMVYTEEGDFYPSYLHVFDDTCIMTGGTITENLYLKDNSYGAISGGYSGNIPALDDSENKIRIFRKGGEEKNLDKKL